MAIANRNKRKEEVVKSAPKEREINALIGKGGSSTKARGLQDTNSDDDVVKPIKLNLYGYHHKDIADILAALPKREGISSRHSYVIKALEERVERDKRKLKLNA